MLGGGGKEYMEEWAWNQYQILKTKSPKFYGSYTQDCISVL